MVDERMMHLFSLIAEQVSDKQELFDNEGKIMAALVDSGCHLHEVDAAITLMQSLVRARTDDIFCAASPGRTKGLRAMDVGRSASALRPRPSGSSPASRSSALSPGDRREILERAMDVFPERIELSQIKTLVAFTLFSGEDMRGNPVVARDAARTERIIPCS